MKTPLDELTGRLLDGRYELVDTIGSGGMATVFRGLDQRLSRMVAVKVLHRHFSVDQDAVRRFQREAEFAAGLSVHPNIVSVYDVGNDGDMHYMVMELVEGHSLKALIEESGALDTQDAVLLGSEIAAALDFAHRHGFVHRDVKPQNVLISGDGSVKVTDFGIALSTDSTQMTRAGTVFGTAHYIAPEQARGEAATSSADIYSLGVILFEMLTGAVPFDADSALSIAMKHVQQSPPVPSTLNRGIPTWLDGVTLRALSKRPADRFRSAAKFREALRGPVTERTAKEAHRVPADLWPSREAHRVPADLWPSREAHRGPAVPLMAKKVHGWPGAPRASMEPHFRAAEQISGEGRVQRAHYQISRRPRPPEKRRRRAEIIGSLTLVAALVCSAGAWAAYRGVSNLMPFPAAHSGAGSGDHHSKRGSARTHQRSSHASGSHPGSSTPGTTGGQSSALGSNVSLIYLLYSSSAVRAGQTLQLQFKVENNASRPVGVRFGASLTSGPTQIPLAARSGPATVTAAPGTRYYTRTFTVPSTAVPQIYDLVATVHNAAGTSMLGTINLSDRITVLPGDSNTAQVQNQPAVQPNPPAQGNPPKTDGRGNGKREGPKGNGGGPRDNGNGNGGSG